MGQMVDGSEIGSNGCLSVLHTHKLRGQGFVIVNVKVCF